MSYNDVHAHHHNVATMNHHHPRRMTTYDTRNYAFHQQQQQQQQQVTPYQSTRPNVQTTTAASNNNINYHHGKKASLAGFDPFSSSSGSSASPMGRDSSPTIGDASGRMMDQQRQSVTPPSAGRPIATSVDGDTPMTTNFERFTNENTKNGGKNPVAKQVNKFLRKAVMVTNMSLGQHSPGSKKKTTKSGTTSPSSSTLSPVVAPRPLVTATPPAPAGAQTVSSPMMNGSNEQAAIQSSDNNNNNSGTSMAKELLELKDQFGHLRIPSLSNNIAPTSFLTGNGGETVTTNCDSEPTPFQLEIPSLREVVTTARLNEFVENYRRHDQNLDLRQFVGFNRMQLQQQIDLSSAATTKNNASAIVKEHIPIVQSLLECAEHGDDISIQGFLTESGDRPADSRAEAVVFQGQRNFTVVFRGTTEQQTKVLGSSKSKKRAVPLDSTKNDSSKANGSKNSSSNIEVYSGFLESYSRVEAECFRMVDKLVNENPFCDVTFSGYSFGAAMATLAAFRYATARPMMRVGCLTLASPKVGFSHFRQVVNATPNLKVMRLELGNGQMESKCQGPTVGGWHAGHTLVLNSSNNNGNGNSSPTNRDSSSSSPTAGSSSLSEKKQPSVSVYKFETPKHKNVGAFFKTSNPGLKKYISILEDLATLQNNSNQKLAAGASNTATSSSSTWPKDFANNAGDGVVVNNEKRLVV